MQSLKKLLDIHEPEMGAPLPMVICSEYRTSICYNQAKASAYTGKINTNRDIENKPDKVAIVRFKNPRVWKFGEPNEDGQSIHPLVDLGLMDFYAFEVDNSKWVKRITCEDNQVKHFLILFHDSMFEILADSYSTHSLNSQFVMDGCQNEIDCWP